MKPYFIMMVGLPGSGKSTIANNMPNYMECEVFSSDKYREKVLGNENDQSNNQLVFQTLYKDMKAILTAGTNVILDATNVTRKSRAAALREINGIDCYKLAYVVGTPIDICVKQDTQRTKSVGTDVIKKFIRSFEFPQLFEGFDSIEIYNEDMSTKPEYCGLLALGLATEMCDFDQNNPHHNFDLFTHCEKLSEQFSDVRYVAGLWHDLGKMYTQTTDDKGISHYINHANVGTYWLTCYPSVLNVNSWNELYEVLFYINEHMHIRDIIKSDKAIEKYRQLWGEDRYNKLVDFMLADNKAAVE